MLIFWFKLTLISLTQLWFCCRGSQGPGWLVDRSTVGFHGDPKLSWTSKDFLFSLHEELFKEVLFPFTRWMLQSTSGRYFLLSVYLSKVRFMENGFPVCTVESNHWLGGEGSLPLLYCQGFPCSFFTYWCTKEAVPRPKRAFSSSGVYFCQRWPYHPKENSVLFSKAFTFTGYRMFTERPQVTGKVDEWEMLTFSPRRRKTLK